MNIQIRGDHLDVTLALQDYVEKKITRLEKYFDAPPERQVSVTMKVERGIHRVEVMLQVHGVLFRAEEASDDMYASIDLVMDKLEQQLTKYRSKLNKRFREKGVKTRVQNAGMASAAVATAAATFDDVDLTQVVRRKQIFFKPMDVQEAVLQMDLLGHDFFVFTNADTDEINVVYKRKGGNYGLIEPS